MSRRTGRQPLVPWGLCDDCRRDEEARATACLSVIIGTDSSPEERRVAWEELSACAELFLDLPATARA